MTEHSLAWLATRLWNARELWTCPADIEKMLATQSPAPEASARARMVEAIRNAATLADKSDKLDRERLLGRAVAPFVADLLAAPCAAVTHGWQPIETAPKDGRKLILAYRNRNNKARTVMARWLTDEEAAETDADGVGLEGGWYECIDNWDDYTEVAIHEGEPSHWMPRPDAPAFDVPVQGNGS